MAANGSADFEVDEKDMPATENAISRLVEGIDPAYFLEKGFHAIAYELEKMSTVNLEIDELERERFKLKRQMQVLSKKITSSIIKSSFDFNKSVEGNEAIKSDAAELLLLIRTLRRSIQLVQRKCRASTSVIASEFKRILANKLREELTIIRTLQKSESRMKELLQGNDIFAFIQIAVEALFATKHYIKYSSVKQLHTKLLHILRKAEEQSKLDGLISSQVHNFVPEQYLFIYSAYNFGSLEKLSAKLHESFKCAFHRSTYDVLLGLLQLQQDADDSGSDNLLWTANNTDQESTFNQLSKLIEQKYFLRALREVGFVLVKLLANYHAILRFHMEEDNSNRDDKEDGKMPAKDEAAKDEENSKIELFDEAPLIVERGIVQKSLLDRMHSTFSEAAFYYNSLLSNFDLIHLKFDKFLTILEITERFRKFGQRHFGNPCPEISQTLECQSNAFFKQYHFERVEELKMFMESEPFTLCPVSVQFSLFDLSEFHFLKFSEEAFDVDGQITEEEASFEIDVGASIGEKQLNFILLKTGFKEGAEVFPPLEILEDSPTHSGSTKLQSYQSCDTPEEDEALFGSPFTAKSMPNLCNTALNLLRIIGRYIRMSRILQCTSEQAIDAILQLYNYFLYTLYQYFCMDFPLQQQQSTFGTVFSSLRLRQLMESINKNYFCESNVEVENKETLEVPAKKMPLPLLLVPQNRLTLEDEGSLFLLAERIIGIDSGIFLSKQMELLRPVLEALVPAKKRNAKLDSFYKSLSTASDLLEASIGCVAARALPYTSILKQIQSMEWAISEIPSQHSAYVDDLLKDFEQFKSRFGQLNMSSYVHVGEQLHTILWSMLSLCTMRVLVQGYSEAKKCSTEGRALQLLDVGQLCNSLEEMSGLRPLPHRAYVENYVKAFYLPQDELNQWIVHHTEYTLSQTSALLNAVTPIAAAKTTMSRIMMNLLDASGIGDSNNPLFQ